MEHYDKLKAEVERLEKVIDNQQPFTDEWKADWGLLRQARTELHQEAFKLGKL